MSRKKIYDLSVPTEESPSEPLALSVSHKDHKELAQSLADFLGCAVEDFPEGLGYANDEVKMNAHTGTHLDAPWHYYPTSEGITAKTVDEIPLEVNILPAKLQDLRFSHSGIQRHDDHRFQRSAAFFD